MSLEPTAMTFNILLKRADEGWLAHCLELDIVATAPALAEVKRDILDLMVAQVEYAFRHDNLDHLYHPAPAEAWREFYSCRVAAQEKLSVPSGSRRGKGRAAFVPPWIVARTCRLEAA